MKGLEIAEYNGEGYEPTFHFKTWRVAFLNHDAKGNKEGITYLERHNETDEVFVLLQGEATLLIGEDPEEEVMEKNKIYVVKQAVWHSIYMTEDAKLLIIENQDTSPENSEYMPYTYNK